MTKEAPQPYVLHNDEEIDRLERQAVIAGIEGHLRHLPVPANATVIGVDLNPDYLAGAMGFAAGLANLSFQEGDLQALPFPDASFDLIWSKYVLYFLPNPEAAIAEFRRVLRPGGSVVVALNEWQGVVLDPPAESLSAR